jgi:hypothetical protein
MKTNEKERFKTLLDERRRMLPVLEANAADRTKDKKGVCTSVLAPEYRFIGIAEFLVNDDIGSFRKNLAKCAELRLRLFERHQAGEEISPSYVSMLAYKELYDALAAADFTLSVKLARIMGGRPQIEAEYDHPFDCAMGYALKTVVLTQNDSLSRATFRRVLSEEDNEDFRGYGLVLDGIETRNEKAANDGLAMVVDGHKKQARFGVFRGLRDSHLCIWGIGLANLAKQRNIEIHVNDELIPDSLII